jgi:tetratricopeptide (TPR) repeat protein
MKNNVWLLILCFMFFSFGFIAGQSSDSIKLKADNLLDEEKYSEALKEYQKLPETAEKLKMIGIAQMKLWNMSAALRSLRQAERSAAKDLSIKAYIAEVLSWNKDFDEALIIYRDIFSKGYNDIEARLAYARTLAWNKEYDNSVSEYKLIIKIDPSNFDAYIGMAQTLSWQKKFDLAIETYQKSIGITNISGEKSVAIAGIAQILSWQGSFEQSIKQYKEAVRLNKKNVDALFGLGEVHEWISKYADAKKYYEQILQIHPDHKSAKAKLLQLIWVK